ncbi:homoserine dehydrogenase [Aminipila butyrica]|uniref:Homoserine dehydrogenase n=1 Tax=Aminipila butyrica TaxID=433296 RepID=A0A858BYL7_9FIRM|nr:homoserine dehydrogenase [Aminipila butyrica]QIB69990.1 homoserine dehydrogenase [Aminipila butyrica]
MKTIKIGLLGLGNIGTGTYKTLEMNKVQITEATGLNLEISKILERDTTRERDITVVPQQFTQDPDEIFRDPEIDIVIELLGGIEPATTFMLEAMKNKKSVVTANKAAVAANFEKLAETAKANQVEFRYEASVGGGIPIINALTTVLQANQFVEIQGILNGTTNYILTQMTDFGLNYEDVLKKAQELGFAEADPTADVEGIDVANKLSILIAILFRSYVAPGQIPTQGISNITPEDIAEAKAENSKIKLIACARMEEGQLTYSVKPTKLSSDHPLAAVSNEFNAVYVTGNAVGELMFYGKGAGPLPTGSAVMGDVLEIAKKITSR